MRTLDPGGRLRLLVVEDDTVVRMLFGMQLERVEVLEATRVHEAPGIVETSRPDAILVDQRLPDGDGLDLVRLLRIFRASRATPIVLMTAGHDEELRAEVLAAGADDYLAKPLDPPSVEMLLRRLLLLDAGARRRRRDRLAAGLRRGAPVDDDLPELAPTAPDRSRRRR